MRTAPRRVQRERRQLGHLDFTNFTINGQSASASDPVALDAGNANGFEDHTGALSGGSFTVTYQQE